MRRQCRNEMKSIESLGQDFVKCDQSRRIISFQEGIDQRETIFIIKHIEIAEHILIFHVRTAESHGLVEDGKCVTHGSVGLVRHDMERFVIDGHALACRHHTQVLHDIVNGDSVEIIGLTARKYGRKNLVLLRCSKDEYSVCRRFLKGLEECIEGCLGKHVHLVDDIYAVSAHLRRYAHLIHQSLDVFDTVIGSGIELMDAVRASFCERLARFACSAWLHVCRRIRAVDHLRKDTGRGGLSDSARSAEEVCMSQLPSQNGILEGLGYIILAYKSPEGVRPVLSG